MHCVKMLTEVLSHNAGNILPFHFKYTFVAKCASILSQKIFLCNHLIDRFLVNVIICNMYLLEGFKGRKLPKEQVLEDALQGNQFLSTTVALE